MNIKEVYNKAKKTITIDRKKYHLYCALPRTEKNFRNLIPFINEKENIKILLDINSDVCLVYGSNKIIKKLKKNKEFLK